TRDLIANLSEPLIMRGYFSEKTHPLLAPLVPRIRDLMTEYGIASGNRITVSFIDPRYDEELEAEANQLYGIKPVPFQVAGRYEASVVNSYFNILIKYGDQHVTLGFDDLIEVSPRKDGRLDVGLRNLEYDLTKSIKKVVYGFQSIATVFENIAKELRLVSIITPASLPESLKEMPETVRKVADALKKESAGKLDFTMINPEAEGVSPDELSRLYGVEPLAVSFFSPETFYMHLLLMIGDKSERIFLAGDMGEAEIRKEIEATLKRTSSGFLKTIGLWTPQMEPAPQMAMMQQTPRDQYQLFQSLLRENYNLEKVDLTSGRVPGDIDVLLVVAPQGLSDKERFSLDQYLMRGGSVVALAGNYLLDLSPYAQSLKIKKAEDGIVEMLSHYGITVEEA
ncbi:MAG: Gldg family protein, partial [Desulfobulbaceae bacterium]|nr:Gldg family protein [Desulfobulbaceae bacterium]